MADALTNTTTLTTTIPTLVAGRVNYYADKIKVYRGLVGDAYRFLVPTGAKAITVSQNDTGAFTLNTEATDPDDALAHTLVGFTLTPVTLRFGIIEAMEADTSAVNRAEVYAEAAGYAWAALEDDDSTYGYTSIAAAAGDSANNLGTSGVALTASLGRQGVALLLAAGAKRPYNWTIAPSGFEELMRDTEAKTFLMNSPGTYAATVGVNPDHYLGQIYGAHVWTQNAVYASSGNHHPMFGVGALGQAYKMVSTPSNPSPAEMHTSIAWDEKITANRINFRVRMDIGGIAQHATDYTHNSFICDIIS